MNSNCEPIRHGCKHQHTLPHRLTQVMSQPRTAALLADKLPWSMHGLVVALNLETACSRYPWPPRVGGKPAGPVFQGHD
jgi:hypothetical protein